MAQYFCTSIARMYGRRSIEKHLYPSSTSNPGGALLFPTLSRLGVHLVEPAFRTITRNVRPFVPFERLKIFRKLLREKRKWIDGNRASWFRKPKNFFRIIHHELN